MSTLKMATKVEFNCEMTCSKCSDKIRKSLKTVSGVIIQSIDIDRQQVVVEVSEKASLTIPDIQNHIEQDTGLKTVIKGIGEGIATVSEFNGPDNIIGVIRLAQLTQNQCLIDGVIDHIKLSKESNHCRIDIHEFGDLRGETFDHVGPVKVSIMEKVKPIASRCLFRGNFNNCDLTNVIGRSIVLKEQESDRKLSAAIIARVSQIYGNEKKICLCSGILRFNDDDCAYRLTTGRPIPSSFDCLLETEWNRVQTIKGTFLFPFNELNIKKLILDGRFRFIVTLNKDRGTFRRPPQTFNTILTPYDGSKFNFNKIQCNELLFKVSRNNCPKPVASIIINNSPFERCSSLMVVDPMDCLPQLLTESSLQMAIGIMSISGNINLRMGFNSLGAAASVNHCHWHLYYQQEPLYLQSIQIVQDGNHFFNDWPLPGFMFEVSDYQSYNLTVQSIMKLVHHVHINGFEHSYNLFITRSAIDCGATIRVFIWIRKASFEPKLMLDIHPALAELSGFFNCKTDETWNQINEKLCIELLKSIEIDNINEYIDLL